MNQARPNEAYSNQTGLGQMKSKRTDLKRDYDNIYLNQHDPGKTDSDQAYTDQTKLN